MEIGVDALERRLRVDKAGVGFSQAADGSRVVVSRGDYHVLKGTQ